ncbi:CAP domain-containing protein [Streptomyces paludis]|uniref:CAP domain-containing protein n=1 Tax=Streptomyces paludis TaxID=2282738 RepID=A0A345HV08_9ACTN|nr:CAP domain-containing protein [Streptomyces paludis]AXG80532.1 CAP domain-containing protein [Streptomyces paludis]
MGRHRRSAAPGAPAVSDPAPTRVARGDGTTAGGRGGGAARRNGRVAKPVRTGLLGASAAMAVGAVAVASGLLPGGGQFTVSGGGATGEQIRSDIAPELQQQGGSSATPTPGSSDSAGAGTERTKKPAASVTPSKAKPSTTPSKESAEAETPVKKRTSPGTPSFGASAGSGSGSGSAADPGSGTETAATSAPPSETVTEDRAGIAPAPSSTATAVLNLVNQERAKVGCAAVRADASLDALAQAYSEDMAKRGFFDHTDPDGNTPWDRADKAGVKNLAGENIARGQATAQAVMDSWMNSDGHRANILNCDYTRLGVGVATGSGGPWWTQNFGF